VETVFLGCFLFGVVFTGLTTLLGAASSAVHVGHFLGHGWHGPHIHHGHANGYANGHLDQPLFLFGVSSLVAFLTWFGAAGYVLTRWFDWPLLATLVLGIGAGLAAAVLVARFLALLRAGERVMDPRDFRLVGTVARVTIGIPGDGVGEIVFTKAGARRSEAARGLNGAPIPRDTEVVVTGYERGVATVQPWDDLYAGRRG
jgi:hypothetical protein